MTFTKEVTVTPVAIGDITVELYSPDPTGDNSAATRFTVYARMSDGTRKLLAGDLVPHLTPAQKGSLTTLMTTIRAKAVAEILP